MSAVFVVLAFSMTSRVPLWNASFKTFYCAGATINAGHDPYRVEPLRSCERAFNPKSELPAQLVEPAPLPGYALAPFALLARLSPNAAQLAFTIAVLLAALLAAAALAACTGAPFAAVLAAFMPLTFLNLAFGEIPPFCALAIAAAAFAVATKRWNMAGVCAALALVQPQVGIAAVLSTLLWVPRARIAALATCAALALVSLATLGVHGNLEYFREVLPAQAYSELVAADQYSLSRLLTMAGVTVRWAMFAAQLQYLLMLAGTLLARYASRAWNAPALIPALPPAIVMIGGAYLHDIQIMNALPAAVIVASLLKASRAEIAGFIMLVLLAIVWTENPGRQLFVVSTFAVAGAAALALSGNVVRRVSLAFGGALITVVMLVAIHAVQSAAPPGPITTEASFRAAPDEYASLAWADYMRATPALTRHVVLPKIPTWAGLLLLAACVGLPALRSGFFAGSSQPLTTL